ncbi:glycosyltransferase 87 family protein [Cohnella zeiphila]|uniref:DUF2029 domain-containing protein n=1 Tax=Cohnella zeiphila TaxID=2761120 RepID=A0A7X0SJF8_9BACL|nr:glycosyltransferase 87 family protein [Cohnella zeiphila]MBB6729780.1 DUF2029 domain-containing protein [Cohnella zeiphila]
MRSLQVHHSKNRSRAIAKPDGGKRIQAFCLLGLGLLAAALAFLLHPAAQEISNPLAHRLEPSPALTAAFSWLHLLPSRQITIWQSLLAATAYAGALWLWSDILYKGERRSSRLVLLIFGAMFAPFAESFRLGTLDSLLLLLLGLSFRLRERGHTKRAAIALALAIHLFIVPLLVLLTSGRLRRDAYVRHAFFFTALLTPVAVLAYGQGAYTRFASRLQADSLTAFWTLPGLSAAAPFALLSVTMLLLAILIWDTRRLTRHLGRRLSYSLMCLLLLLVLPPFSSVPFLAAMPLYLAFIGIFTEKYNDANAALRIGPAEFWGLSCFFLSLPFAAAVPALSIPLLLMTMIVLVRKLRLTQRRKTVPIADYRLNRNRQQVRAK